MSNVLNFLINPFRRNDHQLLDGGAAIPQEQRAISDKASSLFDIMTYCLWPPQEHERAVQRNVQHQIEQVQVEKDEIARRVMVLDTFIRERKELFDLFAKHGLAHPEFIVRPQPTGFEDELLELNTSEAHLSLKRVELHNLKTQLDERKLLILRNLDLYQCFKKHVEEKGASEPFLIEFILDSAVEDAKSTQGFDSESSTAESSFITNDG